jgi:hypothetical protein
MDDKLKIYQELVDTIANMCHTVTTKPEYSRVDLAETIARLIRDAKAKL